jgi:hypothetical protein
MGFLLRILLQENSLGLDRDHPSDLVGTFSQTFTGRDLSMIDAHAIATFMVANRCAVFLSANQMIPHAIPQADDDPRRCSEHCKVFISMLLNQRPSRDPNCLTPPRQRNLYAD